MRHRIRLIAITAAIAVGLGALMLIPGEPAPPPAEADDSPVTPLIAAINEMTMSATPKPADVADLTNKPIAALTQEASLGTTANDATPPVVDPNLRQDTIGLSAVNLRDGPSASSNKISVLQPGAAIGVGETSGTWVKVTLPDGTTGWMSSRYLASAPQVQAPQRMANVETHGPARAQISGGGGDLEGRTAVIGSRLVAYAGPSDSADSIFTLRPGTRVRIAQVSGNWVRIETANGISAWIRR